MKWFLFYLILFGTPAIWGYFGGTFWGPAFAASYVAYVMVEDGWRYRRNGRPTGLIPSLTVGAIFSAIPSYGAYFLGRWLA
jgi:hypothetical protein